MFFCNRRPLLQFRVGRLEPRDASANDLHVRFCHAERCEVEEQLVDQYFSRRYFLIGTTAGITGLLVFRHAIGQVRQGAKAAADGGSDNRAFDQATSAKQYAIISPRNLRAVNLWDGLSGVTGRYCNFGARLPWRNPGGDWLDAAGGCAGVVGLCHGRLHRARHAGVRHFGARSPLVPRRVTPARSSLRRAARSDRAPGKPRSCAGPEAHTYVA